MQVQVLLSASRNHSRKLSGFKVKSTICGYFLRILMREQSGEPEARVIAVFWIVYYNNADEKGGGTG